MDKILVDYKSSLRNKKLSINTINSYVRDILSFSYYLNNEYSVNIVQSKKTQILTYLVCLQKNGKSSATISRNISSLKSFFEYLIDEKIISKSPVVSIHSPKYIKKLPVFLTNEEIKKLITFPNIKSFKGSRDIAILELLFSSGIKVSELINIKVTDISLCTSIIYIKHGVERIVSIGEVARTSIENYLSNFREKKVKDGCDFLFVNINGNPLSRQGVWKMLKYYSNKLNINKDISPQVLRNSFAIRLLNNGVDITSIQEMMGNKNLNAMQKYMKAIGQKSLDSYEKSTS